MKEMLLMFLPTVWSTVWLLVVLAVRSDAEQGLQQQQRQGLPSIAVFAQVGSLYNGKLMECLDSLSKAKRRSRDNADFHLVTSRLLQTGGTDHLVDNFRADLYLSISVGVESRSRTKLIADVKHLALFDNIYSSVVKNIDVDYKHFIQQMAQAGLHTTYDVLLKLGSQSNAHILSHAVECLCGTPSQVLSVLHQFSSRPDLQLLVPHGLLYGPQSPSSDIYPYLLPELSQDLEQFRATAFNNETMRLVDQLHNYLFRTRYPDHDQQQKVDPKV